ncbi:MAG: hypothetical protein AB8B74_05705 [Crocinitomicaceae bacterium]
MMYLKNTGIKSLLTLVFIGCGFISFCTGLTETQQISKDERIVRDKVIEWSDSVFYFHEDYRFENFHAHYTDEFYIVMLRSDQYKKKIDDLKKRKAEKKYTGTQEEYNSDLQILERKFNKFQVIVDSFTLRVKYFEVLFWSNIKTKHGYPVYYAHRFKLSNDFFVMASIVKSSIGNRSADNKIIYN